MQSGDGLVVRIRPRAGRLTPDQARGIARLAALHGNGLIDLSNRANVQLRGVTEASHPALIDGLRALDLIDATRRMKRAATLSSRHSGPRAMARKRSPPRWPKH